MATGILASYYDAIRPRKIEQRVIDGIRLKAAALIPGAKEKFPEKLAEYQKILDADVAAYSFDCRRHGDFLAVFMQRGEKTSPKVRYGGDNTKVVHAINIGRAASVALRPGNIPDLRGHVGFTCELTSTTEVRDEPALAWPRARIGSKTIVIASPDGKADYTRMTSIHDVEYTLFAGMHIADAPRPATDDQIEFIGAGVTLYTPAGMGQFVHTKILDEIGAGFAPTDRSQQ